MQLAPDSRSDWPLLTCFAYRPESGHGSPLGGVSFLHCKNRDGRKSGGSLCLAVGLGISSRRDILVRVNVVPTEQLFPTEGIVLEARQIGRGGEIERLERRIADNRVSRLIDERRVGKSSVVHAALDRLRDQHGWVAVTVDLTRDAAGAGPLIARLLSEARAQGAARSLRKVGLARWAGVFSRGAADPTLQAAASALGERDAATVVSLIASLAEGHAGNLDLAQILAGLEAHALLTEQHVVVFLDELQELASWGEDGHLLQRQLATAARRRGRRVAYVYAGSERTTMRKLFKDGKPLHLVGQEFRLAPISKQSWRDGLQERFAEAGFTIRIVDLEDIIEASGGHPLRTMRVCSSVHEWARAAGAPQINPGVVLRGITEAQKDHSWPG